MAGNGPLAGTKILEVESIGPGPHAAMLLAGLGASVLRVIRPGVERPWAHNPVLNRGRVGEVALDLRGAGDREAFLRLAAQADALIEGFRPGAMERLGVGPDACLARQPRLVYGRITGWGRSGPLAERAGHDINYLALTGALDAIGTGDSGPVVPLNLVGDFGGGGMLLALGIVCALLEARRTGRGQVVDATMLDGIANLMAMTYGLAACGLWNEHRASNVLDGSAWFYTCYRCRDGRYVAVGAIEAQFRERLLEELGFEPPYTRWLKAAPDDADARSRVAARFLERDRDDWAHQFADTDACVSPVLALSEAPGHPQIRALGTLRRVDGVIQPIPAPRFSGTGASSVGARRASLDDWQLGELPVERLDG